MNYISVLLTLLSFYIFATDDVLDITILILVSEDSTEVLTSYYEVDKVEIFQNVLSESGAIDWFKGAKNHDSMLFDTVACYASKGISS